MSSKNRSRENDEESQEISLEEVIKQESFCWCFPCFKCCDTYSVGMKLFLSTVFVLSISVLFMGIVTIQLASSFEGESTSLTGTSLETEEKLQLTRIALKLGELLDQTFEQFQFDTGLYAKMATKQINDELCLLKRSPSYNGLGSVPNTSVKSSNSVWYYRPEGAASMSSIPTFPTDLQDELEQGSVLDFFTYGISRADTYQMTYFGTENRAFRSFPWSSFQSYNAKVDGYYKYAQWDGAQCQAGDNDRGPYDPRCRPWYVVAKTKNDGSTSYIDPYMDASTGSLCITVSVPIKKSNVFAGVVGTDPSIKSIEDSFKAVKIMDAGYAFIINKDGYAMFHKDQDLTTGTAQPISELENTNDLGSGTALFTETSGSISYMKDGQKWYMAFYRVSRMDYIVAAVVSHDDVISGALQVQSDIKSKITLSTIVMVIILVVLVAAISYLSWCIGLMIEGPVLTLSNVCTEITDGNLDVDIDIEETCKDVAVLRNAFKAMLTSVRFGSEAYYSGDIDKSRMCFEEALELFTRVRNQRGIGISQNNLGSVYSQKGEFDKAEKAYMNSIELAQIDLDNAKTDEQKVRATRTLSSRMGNRAVLYMQKGDLHQAEKFILEAIKLDQTTLNPLGFVIKSGTLASVYIKQNRLGDAKLSIDEAGRLLYDENTFMSAPDTSDEDFLTCKSYNQLNHAELCYANGDFQQAYFIADKELVANQILSSGVRQKCFSLMMKVYQQYNAQDAMKALSSLIGSVSSGNKNIMIVYDFSGSMSGGRHRAAMESLQMIFHDYINTDDNVGFIHFNHSVHVDVGIKHKEENLQEFTRLFGTLTNPMGGTAFYQACWVALDLFQNNKANKSRENWIIALTDGEDNSSKKNVNDLVKRLKKDKTASFICVCVDVNQGVYQSCKKLSDATPKGECLDARGGLDAIKDAFKKVAKMLEGQVVLEKY